MNKISKKEWICTIAAVLGVFIGCIVLYTHMMFDSVLSQLMFENYLTLISCVAMVGAVVHLMCR